jgi:hypothetical protein
MTLGIFLRKLRNDGGPSIELLMYDGLNHDLRGLWNAILTHPSTIATISNERGRRGGEHKFHLQLLRPQVPKYKLVAVGGGSTSEGTVEFMKQFVESCTQCVLAIKSKYLIPTHPLSGPIVFRWENETIAISGKEIILFPPHTTHTPIPNKSGVAQVRNPQSLTGAIIPMYNNFGYAGTLNPSTVKDSVLRLTKTFFPKATNTMTTSMVITEFFTGSFATVAHIEGIVKHGGLPIPSAPPPSSSSSSGHKISVLVVWNGAAKTPDPTTNPSIAALWTVNINVPSAASFQCPSSVFKVTTSTGATLSKFVIGDQQFLLFPLFFPLVPTEAQTCTISVGDRVLWDRIDLGKISSRWEETKTVKLI